MDIEEFDLKKIVSASIKDDGWPLNMEFKFIKNSVEQEAVQGAGIYLISFKNLIIYIGKFQPVNRNNIFNDRWLRHLETMTFRGYRVGFGRNSLNNDDRMGEFCGVIINPGLEFALCGRIYHDEPERFKDTGVVTSYNKLRFADQYWDGFVDLVDNSILTDFSFSLFKFDFSSEQSESIVKQKISNVEKTLLSEFKPVCNREYIHNKHYKLPKKNTRNAIIEKLINVCDDNQITILKEYLYKG